MIKHPWAVYAKQAFGSPESVEEYLGRYTHRVAVSNARIVEVTGTHVAFTWRDRKHDHAKRTETLPGGGVP